MRVTLRIVVLGLLGCGALAASDMSIRDLRVQGGAEAASAEYEDSFIKGSGSAGSSGNYNGNLDSSTRIFGRATFNAGHLHRHGGFIWGLGVEVATQNLVLDDKAVPSEHLGLALTTYGVLATAGYGYAWTEHTHLELAPFISGGGAQLRWYDAASSGGFVATSGTGSYFEYGVRAAVYHRFQHRFLIGAEVGYMATSAEAEVTFITGGRSTVTVTSDGPYLSAIVGLRFGP